MEGRAAKRRRTGGVKQRLSKSSAAEEQQLESFLATFLVTMFAWGEFSPQRVQHLAGLAVNDFERAQEEPRIMNDLRSLAASGAAGANAQDCHRDLMKRLEPTSHLPNP